MSKSESKSNRLRYLWDHFSNKPFGKWFFQILLNYNAPYTATMKARVEELGEGYAKCTMKDRRRVRNPFNSIHAIAQMNLGELACNLALFYTLPGDVRAIVTSCHADYTKKARGKLTAECRLELPETIDEAIDFEGECVIRDLDGDEVSRCKVGWKIAPVEKKE